MTLDVDPLTRLAIRHGTDKWGFHYYTPVYHNLFSGLRDKPISLLEIGVGGYAYTKVGGASLAMWADYFHQGRVVGIDVFRKALDLGPRVSVLQGSQTDATFLAAVVADHGPFDIIVDDGSHVPNEVVFSFVQLFPALRSGGFYVIEDVQTTFWTEFGGNPSNGGAILAWAQHLMRGLNHAEIAAADVSWRPAPLALQFRSFHAFHNLFIVEKGDNSEPSIKRYDPANPHALVARSLIEEQMSASPTAEGLAQLAALDELEGRHASALALIEGALNLWPTNLTLLTSGTRVAKKLNDTVRARSFVLRAVAESPDDPTLRTDLENTVAD